MGDGRTGSPYVHTLSRCTYAVFIGGRAANLVAGSMRAEC